MTALLADDGNTLADAVNANILAEAGRRRLNNTELAQALGMTRNQIGQRVRGEVEWKLNEIERAARVFRVPLARILLPHLDSNQEPSD